MNKLLVIVYKIADYLTEERMANFWMLLAFFFMVIGCAVVAAD